MRRFPSPPFLLLLLTGCGFTSCPDPPEPTSFAPIPAPQPVVWAAARRVLRESSERFSQASREEGFLRTTWAPTPGSPAVERRITLRLTQTDEGVVPAIFVERRLLTGDMESLDQDVRLEYHLARLIRLASFRRHPTATLQPAPR